MECAGFVHFLKVLEFFTALHIYIYICMRRFGEYISNRHNISVALDPHGMLK